MMPSMIPPTILLVKVVLIASNEENRDWISPRCRFSKKSSGSFSRCSNSVVFHWISVSVPSTMEIQALAMLTTARNRVKKISPKQMTVSKL